MKGYPKHLNTREDYEYVKAHFPKKYWQKDFKLLLDVMRWYPLGEYASDEGLVVDDTHKIDAQITGTGDEQKTTYLYSELRQDPNAKIFQIGYTIEEVEGILTEE
jgi:hypothetical protein